MKTARMILLWTLVVCVDVPAMVLLASMFAGFAAPDILMQICAGLFIAALVLMVVCIIFAIATHGKSLRQPQLQKGLGIPVAIAKIAVTPFFVLVSLWALLYFLATAITFLSIHLASMGFLLGTAAIFIVPIAALVCYLLIMATSAFSVSAIIIEYRKGTIALSIAVIFSILQFIPVADVVSYVFIAVYFRNRNKAADQQGRQSASQQYLQQQYPQQPGLWQQPVLQNNLQPPIQQQLPQLQQQPPVPPQ